MLFSVITPTLNAGAKLRGCIESVARQKHARFEHIIVDGGSTDGTVELLKDECLNQSHLTFSSEPDNGLYDAMNRGVARAQGDYLIFLGADDRLADDSVLNEVAEEIGKAGCDVIYGNVRLIGTGWKDSPPGTIYDGAFDLNKLLHKNICHQAIFYSREIIEKAGWFNSDYCYFADWDYNLRCYSLGEFKYINLIISEYNTAGRSTGGADNSFHAFYFENVRRYLGVSVFSAHFRDLSNYLIFAGKLRLKRFRDPKGLVYFAAAFWHSHLSLARLFVQAIMKIKSKGVAAFN